jgi:hypothetical protein
MITKPLPVVNTSDLVTGTLVDPLLYSLCITDRVPGFANHEH